jgi:hypothetical protein
MLCQRIVVHLAKLATDGLGVQEQVGIQHLAALKSVIPAAVKLRLFTKSQLA